MVVKNVIFERFSAIYLLTDNIHSNLAF